MQENVTHIFIEEEARGMAITARLLERFPNATVTWCDRSGRSALARDIHGPPRRALYLRHHKGAFIKPFPRHLWYEGGGGEYYNLILGYNCYGSCHYCFIQSIFDDAVPTMYVNENDMVRELSDFLQKKPDAWISTGEYIDSLQLDRTTRYTERIMDVMRDFPESVLELRTKSGNVDHLPPVNTSQVTVAYSISPEDVVANIEPGTASLERRLTKAKLLHSRGYRIAIRIDPIITTERFAASYAGLPDHIETHLGWQRVSGVFLGIMRFDDDLLKHLAASTAARRLLEAEYVRCPDGRYRPSRPARERMYRTIVGAIGRYRSDLKPTIMMEPDYVIDAATRSKALRRAAGE